jgi:hypothetical protein
MYTYKESTAVSGIKQSIRKIMNWSVFISKFIKNGK